MNYFLYKGNELLEAVLLFALLLLVCHCFLISVKMIKLISTLHYLFTAFDTIKKSEIHKEAGRQLWYKGGNSYVYNVEFVGFGVFLKITFESSKF